MVFCIYYAWMLTFNHGETCSQLAFKEKSARRSWEECLEVSTSTSILLNVFTSKRLIMQGKKKEKETSRNKIKD